MLRLQARQDTKCTTGRSRVGGCLTPFLTKELLAPSVPHDSWLIVCRGKFWDGFSPSKGSTFWLMSLLLSEPRSPFDPAGAAVFVQLPQENGWLQLQAPLEFPPGLSILTLLQHSALQPHAHCFVSLRGKALFGRSLGPGARDSRCYLGQGSHCCARTFACSSGEEMSLSFLERGPFAHHSEIQAGCHSSQGSEPRGPVGVWHAYILTRAPFRWHPLTALGRVGETP